MGTTYNYRRPGVAPSYRDQYVVPRLELDTARRTRYNDVNNKPPRYYDANQRRARTEHGTYRAPHETIRKPRMAVRPGRVYINSQPNYVTETPDYVNARPNYVTDRPNYGANKPYINERPNYATERPNYRDRPYYDEDRPNYRDRPNYADDRPNYDRERPNYADDRSYYDRDRPNYDRDRPNYVVDRPKMNDLTNFVTEEPTYVKDKPKYVLKRRPMTDSILADPPPPMLHRRRTPSPRDQPEVVYHYHIFDDEVVDDFETARVSMYTHDSQDPYSCMCYPRASDKKIPTMMYDKVRCPHPEHFYQPAKEDLFTYPWTVQTHRPPRTELPPLLPYGYREGQRKPPSAVTAPPFTNYRGKEPEHYRHQYNKARGEKPVPHTAPPEPIYSPLLSEEPTDRRLRRTKRRKFQSLPTLEEEISPEDSISQVQPQGLPQLPPRAFRSDSIRLHTVDGATMGRVNDEILGQNIFRKKALSTPRFRLPPPSQRDFPQTPTRIFKGEYVDPNDGKSYKYDIKYGRTILGGTKRLKTV